MLEKTDPNYKNWIVDLKQKIRQTQIKAAIKENTALIGLYWDLGEEIARREFENTYEFGFFNLLSKDLRAEFPEIKGFSESNLQYCKKFYLFYNQYVVNLQQVIGEFKIDKNPNRHQVGDEFKNDHFLQNIFIIPWRHHVEIITKCKTPKEAHFYISKTTRDFIV